jgi:DNA replication protein DnaC
VKQDKIELLKRDLNVSSLENTFENFAAVPGTEKALKVFKQFAEGNLGTPMLLCVGDNGSGKTHLLESLVIRRYELGRFARVIKFHQFLNSLKSAMNERGSIPNYDQILNAYCTASILCLDDIGMGGKETPWVVGVLEALIDERYHHRLETVMTTNMDIKELPPRVYSRLMDREVSTIVTNKGTDYRLRK